MIKKLIKLLEQRNQYQEKLQELDNQINQLIVKIKKIEEYK